MSACEYKHYPDDVDQAIIAHEELVLKSLKYPVYLLDETKGDYMSFTSLQEAIEYAESIGNGTQIYETKTGNIICQVGLRKQGSYTCRRCSKEGLSPEDGRMCSVCRNKTHQD